MQTHSVDRDVEEQAAAAAELTERTNELMLSRSTCQDLDSQLQDVCSLCIDRIELTTVPQARAHAADCAAQAELAEQRAEASAKAAASIRHQYEDVEARLQDVREQLSASHAREQEVRFSWEECEAECKRLQRLATSAAAGTATAALSDDETGTSTSDIGGGSGTEAADVVAENGRVQSPSSCAEAPEGGDDGDTVRQLLQRLQSARQELLVRF